MQHLKDFIEEKYGVTCRRGKRLPVTFSQAYRATVDFDPGIDEEWRESNGADDIFITKLDENGNLVRN